jgi:hypothetical protein
MLKGRICTYTEGIQTCALQPLQKKGSPRIAHTVDRVPLSDDTLDAQLLRDNYRRLLSNH